MAASLLAPLAGLARSARRTGFEPCLEIIEQRQGFFCAAALPLIRWFAPDIGRYSINRADAVEGFLGDGGHDRGDRSETTGSEMAFAIDQVQVVASLPDSPTVGWISARGMNASRTMKGHRHVTGD